MKTETPTPFNNAALQHLIHESNRLTSAIIRYSDHMKKTEVQQNDSRLFVINEYCKSIRKEVDVYYQAVKDNYDVNAKLSEQLSALQQENDKLRQQLREQETRTCPNCNSVDDVVMFTADLDLCKRCGQKF